jgi:hypothetical protein
VALQGGLIVVAFVAEQGAERVVAIGAGNEPIPVVVARLVTDVTDQGAVGFAERVTPPLAFGVVGFRQVWPVSTVGGPSAASARNSKARPRGSCDRGTIGSRRLRSV